MCGIAGIATTAATVDRQLLEMMGTALYHRGPDADGTYIDGGVGLVSRRLSIIDLSEAGRMPMTNETGDIWIVYNGELYNHQALRSELEARGHVYHSQTDTETIIHAYEEYGLECLARFNGIFAFGLYDGRRLVLARDPMGVKPLYYTWDGQTLAFASEMKVLLKAGFAPREVDPEALSLYFSLGYVPSPHCIIAGVQKLMPGHYLLLEDGQITIKPYWLPQATPNHHHADLVAMTRAALDGAVKRQLMSDVPVGVFLSGGVDSSIITAVAQRYHTEPMDTFSVGFADADGQLDTDDIYNQDVYFARQVAEAIGTRHHEIIVRTDDGITDLLQQTIRYIDEPVWESSFVSQHLMSRLARDNGVIVVLTGDGGDELFAGYPWYVGARRFEVFNQIPFLKPMLVPLSMVAGSRTLGMKARDLRRKLGQDVITHYRLTFEIFDAVQQADLIHADILERIATDPVNPVLARYLGAAERLPDQLAMADMALWVREHFNHRIDRMSMMNSIEARVPFQDMEVVGFALQVAMEQKMPRNQSKYLLREAFADLLPEVVLKRPKRPFATPTQPWLRGPLRTLVLDTLLDTSIPHLNAPAVRATVERFMAGDDVQAYRLWTLLNFHLWYDSTIRGNT